VTDKKSPLEQALDLLFYAPIGLVLGAEEVIPQLIERGRQQVTMARMFGQFAVQQGQTEAGKALAKAQEQATAISEQLSGRVAPSARQDGAGRAPAAAAHAAAPAASPAKPARAAAAGNGPSASKLAIPDYDSLSASQVVPRLAGLSTDELEAVRAYESAKRGRKTILNKVAQLQAS
jgi:hypothetical protein